MQLVQCIQALQYVKLKIYGTLQTHMQDCLHLAPQCNDVFDNYEQTACLICGSEGR